MTQPVLDVLLVDDNAAIRDLLVSALCPLARVTACGDVDEALRRSQQQAPDLVISDYRMPGRNGLELLATLQTRNPVACVVLLAARADIAGPLAACNAHVEEFIEKPFLVDEAVARIQKILHRITLSKTAQQALASTASFRGTLEQMSVVDLVQTVDLGRKSCRIALISPTQERAELFFLDGQLRHATLGESMGEEAVYVVAGWSVGNFQIDFSRFESPHTVQHSTQSVLMEAMRRFDEEHRDGGFAPQPTGNRPLDTAAGF